MGAHSWILSALAVLGVVLSARAAPAFPSHLEARQTITTLGSTQTASFKPYTLYASTAYCQPSATLTWSCGGESFPYYIVLPFWRPSRSL